MNKFAFAFVALGCLSVPVFAATSNEKPMVMAQMGSGDPGPRGPGGGFDPDRDRGDRERGPGFDRDRGDRDRGPGFDRDRGDRDGGPGVDRDRGYRDRDGGYAPRQRCRWWRDSYGETHR